jgi:hypothetical protein
MPRLKIAGSIFSFREFFSFFAKREVGMPAKRGEAAAQPATEPGKEAASQQACLPALI